jgi:polar amino acid transport system substrate-binding protein
MSATAERAQRVNFSDPYYQVTQVLVVKGDNKATLEQMLTTGKKIGVQRGTVTAKYLEELSKKPGMKFTLVQYDSTDLSMQTCRGPHRRLRHGQHHRQGRAQEGPEPEGRRHLRRRARELRLRRAQGRRRAAGQDQRGPEAAHGRPYWQELKKKYDIE